jgi:tRNA A-37 threonylcarbamoyl transferase component Bud32
MQAIVSHCPVCAAACDSHSSICERCGLVLSTATLLPGDLRPGDSLDGGRYLLLRPLTKGGMGQLFLAQDRRAFGRQVVVKCADDPIQLQREAERLAAIEHPAVPRLLAFLWEQGRAMLVMEWIDGANLLAGLSSDEPDAAPGQPYSLPDLLRWGIQLCELLDYLNARPEGAVVHGDIKPENLMLSAQSGALYLIDFGAAGGGYGTPGYAAPEQYQGQATAATDLYGLAATLYHLATDDDPTAHPFHFPRLGELGPLGVLLGEALRRDPHVRPAVATVRRRLEALLELPGTGAILAPNGAYLHNKAELVAWAAHHWQVAALWRQSGMERALASWLPSGRPVLPPPTGDANADLDAALATLDHANFGAEAPRLNASATVLTLGNGGTVLRIANIGRRYVQARVIAPSWVAVTPSQLLLAPGDAVSLSVRLLRRWGRGSLYVEGGGALLLAVALR